MAAAPLVTYFDPQPTRGEWPARLPSPFAADEIHPLARRAAQLVMDELRGASPMTAAEFTRTQRGKMFGVLVVADAQDRVGFLRGFSGTLASSWQVDGFVGPLFDAERRAATWPAGEAELLDFDRRLTELSFGPLATNARDKLTALEAQQRAEAEALAAAHEASRRTRHEARARLDAAAAAGTLGDFAHRAALHALTVESRTEAMAHRQQRARHREERAAGSLAIAALDEERAALRKQQAARSCELLEELFAGYSIASARGEARSLRSLFAPATPPGGAGDCAAPKLFGHAQRAGLRPLALAEFWWGPPPLTGGRQEGGFYPACRGKCGPVLGHMLDGLDGEAPPLYGSGIIAAHEPTTLYEDRWLLIVDKPAGLLSVPGRSNLLRDSVLSRLRARHPEASGPLVVHRLDLDTSGLLLAAKDSDTHQALQRLFSRREIEKRYVAWLAGSPAGDTGRIELALRVDPEDRPRHVYDPLHGKRAVTDWQVLTRDGDRTRVALYPRTGRTHQLRVHAAHVLGLGAAIVGDRLYGQPGARLLLHAEALSFVHPHTGERVALERPAPF